MEDDFTELSTLVASSDSDDLMAAAALAQQISQTVTDSISDPDVQAEILEALDALSGGLETAADTAETVHGTPDTLYGQKATIPDQIADKITEATSQKTIKKLEKAQTHVQNSIDQSLWDADATRLVWLVNLVDGLPCNLTQHRYRALVV